MVLSLTRSLKLMLNVILLKQCPRPSPVGLVVSCMFFLNRRLPEWCLQTPKTCASSIIGKLFGENLVLFRDGIHHTLNGAALISKNLSDFIKHPKVDRVMTCKQSCSLTWLYASSVFMSSPPKPRPHIDSVWCPIASSINRKTTKNKLNIKIHKAGITTFLNLPKSSLHFESLIN